MRKALAIVGMVAALALFQSNAWAQVAGTSHDFAGAGNPDASYQNLASGDCETCHFPHSPAEGQLGPLWNHEASAGPWTPYSSATMLNNPGQPGNISQLCLSCHDGTVAVDSYGGNTGSQFMKAAGVVGTDLSNDHPIGFSYAAVATAEPTDYAAVASGVIAGSFPLYNTGNTDLECATCHNPHDDTETAFLRFDKQTICSQCHITK